MDAVELAGLLALRFRKDHDSEIDEPRLHRMLYLMQRESLIRRRKPLFKNAISAYRHGPVVNDVHFAGQGGMLGACAKVALSDVERKCFEYIVAEYSDRTPLSLSRLTCAECSWSRAREQASPDGEYQEISISDMEQDAERVRKRRRSLLKICKCGGTGCNPQTGTLWKTECGVRNSRMLQVVMEASGMRPADCEKGLMHVFVSDADTKSAVKGMSVKGASVKDSAKGASKHLRKAKTVACA